MVSLNKVLLVGHMTRDPEVRTLANGTAMARLGMAVNRSWLDRDGKKREEATFFNLVAFDKSAENLGKYAKKGTKLFIDGSLSARTVTNDKGESRTYHDVQIQHWQILNGVTPAMEYGEEEESA